MSGEVVFYPSPGAVRQALQEAVDALLRVERRPGQEPLRVLEAGAGKRTRLRVADDARVVGVDTDDTAMSLNPRLDERIVGDLYDYAAPPGSFDLITCWYVLEHVDRPDVLLDRFATWAAPGGLVVLAVPDLRSPKALLTKLTPHRFHVWFRRRVLGFPNAGTPGYGPYPTTLRSAIAPRAIAERCAVHGLSAVFEASFEDGKQVSVRAKLRLTGWRWRAVRVVTRVLTAGALDAMRTEYVVVLRRGGPAPTEPAEPTEPTEPAGRTCELPGTAPDQSEPPATR
jgi:SAM-dependent methyltransferase